MELYQREIDVMGMPLTQYKWKGAFANVAVGDTWATIYDCRSTNPGNGEMQELLKLLKYIYRARTFGCTVALNDTMAHILKKLEIKEFDA